MRILTVVTSPPDIYHGCFTQKMFWGYKFTLVNMKSWLMRNVRKHREINNSKQYIALYISSKIDCLDKREVSSSKARDYMGIPGKGRANFLVLSTIRPNKKRRARFVIPDNTNQDFGKLLKKSNNFPNLG